MKYLENLIKQDLYQIFVLACPAYLPFVFARHSWLVTNKKGLVSRYEVRHYRNDIDKSYLHLNAESPFQGTEITFFVKKHFWKAKLVGYVEGGENSVAHKMVEFIEKSKENYPYLNRYFITGPNSNTYLKWVLSNFPEFKIKLSWRFVGKDFKK